MPINDQDILAPFLSATIKQWTAGKTPFVKLDIEDQDSTLEKDSCSVPRLWIISSVDPEVIIIDSIECPNNQSSLETSLPQHGSSVLNLTHTELLYTLRLNS